MFKRLPRNQLKPSSQRIRLLSPVGFNITDDNIPPRFQLTLSGFEHGVGLADTGAHAEENFEPPAFALRGIALKRGQQGIWTWAQRLSHASNLNNSVVDSVKNFM